MKSKTYTQSKQPLDKNERSEFCQSSVKQTHFQNLKKKRKWFFWSQGHFKTSLEYCTGRNASKFNFLILVGENFKIVYPDNFVLVISSVILLTDLDAYHCTNVLRRKQTLITNLAARTTLPSYLPNELHKDLAKIWPSIFLSACLCPLKSRSQKGWGKIAKLHVNNQPIYTLCGKQKFYVITESVHSRGEGRVYEIFRIGTTMIFERSFAGREWHWIFPCLMS